MNDERKWRELTSATKKWLRGWVAIMDKDMNQKIVWHDQIDDSVLFYYPLPQSLTREQFEKINAAKDNVSQ